LKFEAAHLRQENDLAEFAKMKELLALSKFDENEFHAMLRRLRKPFQCRLEDRDIALTDSTCAMMISNQVEAAIAGVLVPAARKRDENDNAAPKKKQRTGGSAAVNTVSGACGVTALHKSSCRDNNLSKQEREKKKRALKKEEKATSQLVGAIVERRNKYEPIENENEGGVVVVVDAQENGTTMPVLPPVALPRPRRSDYWWLLESEEKSQYKIFLGMFFPQSKVMSSNKSQQWNVISEKILPVLSKAQFDAKHESLTRRLEEIANKLKDYDGVDD
jgi:hypothetical protein